MATDGYYSPTPLEQVSVTLSGNPTTVSDHLFLAPGFNVSVYSIDWERPRVSRDWVWSGCQDGQADGLATGKGNIGSNRAGLDNGCLGSEIDLGFYPVVNGTAGTHWDTAGDVSSVFYLPPSIYTTHLYQGPEGIDCMNPSQTDGLKEPGSGLPQTYSLQCTEMDGGGRNVLQGFSNSHDVYYGASAR